ncbi:MAG TPA: hypothetical protein VIA06_18175 [Candidatus Dormibacteraeota bacterium]|nr:hypothetical protein [Candidatus Dormibacteraeota bacterium]
MTPASSLSSYGLERLHRAMAARVESGAMPGMATSTWFNDPHSGLIAIALTHTVGFLFNGALTEFDALAA